MKKIRIGHIGTMHDHSESTLAGVLKLSDYFEVVGLVPESDERYEEIKNRDTYKKVPRMTKDELFSSGIDAALIEGYEKDLIKNAYECVKRGIHVHIDKPAGINVSEFYDLLKLAKKNNVVVHMGYMYRYNPSIIKTKEMIKSGELGEIYSIEAHMNCLHRQPKLKWLNDFKGGMMFFLGCHLIDVIYGFQGVPEKIFPLNKIANNEYGSKDFGMAVFEYKNGVSFAKSCAVEHGGYLRRQIVICGTNGTVEINPTEKMLTDDGMNLVSGIKMCVGDEFLSWTKEGKFEMSDAYARYDNMMVEFAKCVNKEMENPYSYEYELRLQMILMAACGEDIDYKQEINI